jgi:hypothetical protein
MRGLEAFVKSRLDGRKVRRVNVDCFLLAPSRTQGNIIDVEPDDDLDKIDWRFVAGLTVQISGDDKDRRLAVFDRVLPHHPKYVITLMDDYALIHEHGETKWQMYAS